MKPTTAFALLAPVPEEHLIAGEEVSKKMGKVAFGSRARNVFVKADQERMGEPVEVLIYPSHPSSAGTSQAVAAWRALYVGFVEAEAGVHPNESYRPGSTESDHPGHWTLFWEVRDLRQVTEKDVVEITSLRGLGKKKFYAPDFVPKRPLRIEYPWGNP